MMDTNKRDNPLYTYKPYVSYHHGPHLPTNAELLQKWEINFQLNVFNVGNFKLFNQFS